MGSGLLVSVGRITLLASVGRITLLASAGRITLLASAGRITLLASAGRITLLGVLLHEIIKGRLDLFEDIGLVALVVNDLATTAQLAVVADVDSDVLAGLVLLSLLDSNNLGSRCATILIRVELRGRDALNDRECRLGLRLSESARKGRIDLDAREAAFLAVHAIADNDCAVVLVGIELVSLCVDEDSCVIL